MWVNPSTFNSWYISFSAYSQANRCPDSWDGGKEIVKPEKFIGCLNEFLNSGFGRSLKSSIIMSNNKDAVMGFR